MTMESGAATSGRTRVRMSRHLGIGESDFKASMSPAVRASFVTDS